MAGAPIFAVARMTDLPSSFYKGLGTSPQLERLAQTVSGLSLAGQPERDTIKLVLEAECDSLNDAFQLATFLDVTRMGAAVALSNPNTHEMSKLQAALLLAISRQLKVAYDDRWVRLSLDVTPQMLEAAASTPAKNTVAPSTR